MTSVKTTKNIAATPKIAYEIVKNFEAYPEFLPWCAAARTLNRRLDPETGKEVFLAELAIRYKFFHETFTTQVTCDPVSLEIDIQNVKGPFKKLASGWKFRAIEHAPDNSEIHFFIDFEFRIGMFQKIISVFFEEAMRRMTDAFEKRIVTVTRLT